MRQVEVQVIDSEYIHNAEKRLMSDYDIDCTKFDNKSYVEQVVKRVMEKNQIENDGEHYVTWAVEQRKHELRRVCLPCWVNEREEKLKIKEEGTLVDYLRNTIYLIFQNDYYFADDIWKDMYMMVKTTLNSNAFISVYEMEGYTAVRGISNLNSLPFPVKDNKVRNMFSKAMDVLTKKDNIRLFQFKKRIRRTEEEVKTKIEDITRYGYKKTMSMYLQVKDGTFDNSFFFDKMLGISLTNTFFVCISTKDYADLKWGRKNIEEEFSKKYLEQLYDRLILCRDLEEQPMDNIFMDFIKIVGKIEPLFIRNWIAQILMYFLQGQTLDNEVECKIKDVLKQLVIDINECYQTLLDICICEEFKDIEKRKKEELEEYVLHYEECMNGNIDGYMDNSTVNTIMNICCGVSSENLDELHVEQIPKTKERMTNIINTYTNLYAQIHRAVMEGYFEGK